MKYARCNCRDCRLGDDLPVYLQGIPGARQLTLLITSNAEGKIKLADPLGWTDALRAACADRCEGDPPCYEMNGSGPVDAPYCNNPCGECLRDCGIEPGDEFDEAAAVRRLL